MPIKCLYFEHLARVMFDVSNKFVLSNILHLFKKIPDIHIYSTQAVIVSIIIIYEYLKQDSLISTKSTVFNRVLCLPNTSHKNIM